MSVIREIMEHYQPTKSMTVPRTMESQAEITTGLLRTNHARIFDSFFVSGCPIPATLAPMALHCLLNQLKMPSFELTFKAVQYSVDHFSFLSSLPVLPCWFPFFLLLPLLALGLESPALILCRLSCNCDFTHAIFST